jgi:short-subunit dehydrogenase
MYSNIFLITGHNSMLGGSLVKRLNETCENSEFYLISKSGKKLNMKIINQNKFYYFNVDFTDISRLVKIIRYINKLSKFRIRVLILCAAIKRHECFKSTSLKNFQNDINVNYISNIAILKYLFSKRINNNFHVINIASGAGVTGIMKNSSYSSSKGASQNLIESLYHEFDKSNFFFKNIFTGIFKNKEQTKHLAEEIVNNLYSKKNNIFLRIYPFYSFFLKMFPKFKLYIFKNIKL